MNVPYWRFANQKPRVQVNAVYAIPTLQPQTRGLNVIILTEEQTQDPKDATISP